MINTEAAVIIIYHMIVLLRINQLLMQQFADKIW